MSQQAESTCNGAHNQAQNQFQLRGPEPRFIQLKITVDLEWLTWQASAGAAGAGCYLRHYEGSLPKKAARGGEAGARLYALSQAVRKLRFDYAEARIVSIDLDPANVNAPIARLELGGQRRWAA